MCGLVGVVTKNGNGLTRDQVDAFNDLLFIDALRGMDSTGVFLIDRDGSMDMAKEATASPEFRTKAEYKDLLASAFRSGRALVGHNRAATRGTVTDQNAHPFVVDDRITLVHNGTLWNGWEKMTKSKVDVDSHAIAHKIHECGDDVEKALQQVDGAYALIWHDFKNNTLNFIRNQQRPLHFVETTNAWFWASEANMLEWIMSRHKFKQETEVCELEAGSLTTYDFSNSSWKVESKEIKLELPRHTTSYPHHNAVRNLHQYDSCGMDNWEGWEQEYNLTPPPPRVHEETRLERARLTGRTISAENELARKKKLSITSVDCHNIWHTLVQDRTAHMGTCVEYQTVGKDTDSFGYWLYATLDSDPRFLIKIFIDKNTPEIELMDACLRDSKAMFQVASRQWRSYDDPADGAGYAMFNADSIVFVDVEANAV